MIEVSCFGDAYECEARIYFRFMPGYPETRVDPAEPDGVEIEQIHVKLGDRWQLADHQLFEIITGLNDGDSDLLQEAHGQMENDREEAADARREDRQEGRE